MKKYYLMQNVGRVKYLVNFHDGQSKHLDGSEFWDIRSFKSKVKASEFMLGLLQQGYKNNSQLN